MDRSLKHKTIRLIARSKPRSKTYIVHSSSDTLFQEKQSQTPQPSRDMKHFKSYSPPKNHLSTLVAYKSPIMKQLNLHQQRIIGKQSRELQEVLTNKLETVNPDSVTAKITAINQVLEAAAQRLKPLSAFLSAIQMGYNQCFQELLSKINAKAEKSLSLHKESEKHKQIIAQLRSQNQQMIRQIEGLQKDQKGMSIEIDGAKEEKRVVKNKLRVLLDYSRLLKHKEYIFIKTLNKLRAHGFPIEIFYGEVLDKQDYILPQTKTQLNTLPQQMTVDYLFTPLEISMFTPPESNILLRNTRTLQLINYQYPK